MFSLIWQIGKFVICGLFGGGGLHMSNTLCTNNSDFVKTFQAIKINFLPNFPIRTQLTGLSIYMMEYSSFQFTGLG